MTTWRTIPSFPDYEASDKGQIRRVRPGSRQRVVHPLKQFRDKNGYWSTTLWVDGKSKSQWTHCLICEAFNGRRPDGMQAAHEDGKPDNNSASNLSWKTPLDNAHDKLRHGTENIGERNGCAVLTSAQAREIKERYAALPRSSGGKRVKKGALAALAAEYGVTVFGINSVVTGRTWRHL